MSGWNFDLTSAPLDRRIWISTKCEKVSVTRWNEKRSAWDGLATGETPIAWQPYVVPTHPNFVSDGGASAQADVRGLASAKAAAPLSDREYVEKIADRVIAERSDLGLNIVTKHICDDVGGGA
ncbi:hypothetical protein G6L12_08215 [Agrobacterium rhizogenes]|nr:hypothetical protein [Rhizobium rhizogenes]NTF74457.1 hypothetical protein [Rhizobium rhizogenes]